MITLLDRPTDENILSPLKFFHVLSVIHCTQVTGAFSEWVYSDIINSPKSIYIPLSRQSYMNIFFYDDNFYFHVNIYIITIVLFSILSHGYFTDFLYIFCFAV